MIDPDGVAEILGYTCEDWFAVVKTKTIDTDGVCEILGSDGIGRIANIYRSDIEEVFTLWRQTPYRINIDTTKTDQRYKISFVGKAEGKRTISKMVVDE